MRLSGFYTLMISGYHFVHGRKVVLAIETASSKSVNRTISKIAREVHEDQDLANPGVDEEYWGFASVRLKSDDRIVLMRLLESF
jgi:hypothetical protein